MFSFATLAATVTKRFALPLLLFLFGAALIWYYCIYPKTVLTQNLAKSISQSKALKVELRKTKEQSAQNKVQMTTDHFTQRWKLIDEVLEGEDNDTKNDDDFYLYSRDFDLF